MLLLVLLLFRLLLVFLIFLLQLVQLLLQELLALLDLFLGQRCARLFRRLDQSLVGRIKRTVHHALLIVAGRLRIGRLFFVGLLFG